MDRDDRRRGAYTPCFAIQHPDRPPTPQEAEWASDANAFVAQESEESTSYSVRVASCDLLDMLVDRLSARVLPAVQANLGLVIAQSGDASAARVSRNSAEPSSITGTPGMNLSESSFGVVSVWMNIERAE